MNPLLELMEQANQPEEVVKEPTTLLNEDDEKKKPETNPLLELMENTPTPAEERTVIDINSAKPPIDVRRDRDLSNKSGLPEDLVETDPEAVKRHIDVNDIDSKTRDHPKTRSVILDKKLGPAVNDEVDFWITLEDLANRGKELAAGVVRDVVGRTLSGLGHEMDIIGRASGKDKSIVDYLPGLLLAPAALSQVLLKQKDEPPLDLSWMAKTNDKLLRDAGKEIKDVGDAIDSGETSLTSDITRGVGQLAGQIALFIATGGTSSLLTMSAQGADVMAEKVDAEPNKGGAVSELLGLEEQGARDLAVMTGATVTAITEKIGLDKILNRIPPNIKNRVMKQFADISIAGGIEALQEVMEAVAHDLIRLALTNRDTEMFGGIVREAQAAGGSAAIVRAFVNTAVKGKQLHAESRQAKQAEAHKERLQEVFKNAGQSKVAAESPDLYKEVVDRIVTDTDLEGVRVNAAGVQAFYQAAGQPEQAIEFFEEAGVEKAEVQKAMRLGTDLIIPTSDFIMATKNLNLEEGVLANVREDEQGFTIAETEVVTAEQEKAITKQADEARQEMAGTSELAEIEESASAIGRDFRDQAKAAGLPNNAATQQASLIENFFLTEAVNRKREGKPELDIRELYNRTGLQITRESFAGQKALEQSVRTPEFKKWFGDSKIRDEKGDPLVVYHSRTEDFAKFDTKRSEMGTHFGTADQANDNLKKNIDYGEEWAPGDPEPENMFDGANITPVYLSIKNPLRVTDPGSFNDWVRTMDTSRLKKLGLYNPETEANFNRLFPYILDFKGAGPAQMEFLQKALRDAGYDGIVYLNRFEGVTKKELTRDKKLSMTDEQFLQEHPDAKDSYVVLEPSQIQSIFEPETSKETQTTQFKNWFGDSKVINERGGPLVVYHGTNADITQQDFTFEPGRAGGIYFTPDPEFAKTYGPNLAEVYLKIENPFDILNNPEHQAEAIRLFNEAGGWNFSEDALTERGGDPNFNPEIDGLWELFDKPDLDLRQTIIDMGFDGVVSDESDPGQAPTPAYIVFNPDQIQPVVDSEPLKQSAAPLQEKPMKLKGTGPHGRILNWDLGEALNARHLKKYGRPLNPDDAKDYRVIVRELNKEYQNQFMEIDTGTGWYVEDVATAIETTKLIIPELENSNNRDMFLTLAALLSPQQKPTGNWENAILAMQGYLETGKIPVRKPNGMNWGVPGQTTGLQLFQYLIETQGLEGALSWTRLPHTGRELAQLRMDSGLFSPAENIVQSYLANETNLTESFLGIYAFGPKVGDFMMNATGIDQDAVTVDLWLARTYNRMIGRLLDVSEKERRKKEIKSATRGKGERIIIKRVIRDLAELNNVDPSAMQAALWYFEQRLYKNHGINTKSENFSGAAETAAKKRSIVIERADPGADRIRGPSPVGDEALYQTDGRLEETAEPVSPGLGRLFSPLFKAVSIMKIPSWKQEEGRASAKEILQKLNAMNAGDVNLPGTDFKQAIKWSGVTELLESEALKDNKFSRSELLDFINGRGPFLEERIGAEDSIFSESVTWSYEQLEIGDARVDEMIDSLVDGAWDDYKEVFEMLIQPENFRTALNLEKVGDDLQKLKDVYGETAAFIFETAEWNPAVNSGTFLDREENGLDNDINFNGSLLEYFLTQEYPKLKQQVQYTETDIEERISGGVSIADKTFLEELGPYPQNPKTSYPTGHPLALARDTYQKDLFLDLTFAQKLDLDRLHWNMKAYKHLKEKGHVKYFEEFLRDGPIRHEQSIFYKDEPLFEYKDSLDKGYNFWGNDELGYVRSSDNKWIAQSVSEVEIQFTDEIITDGHLNDVDKDSAKWSEYTTPPEFDYDSLEYKEIKLTLPDFKFDFYETVHFPDRNLLSFLRVNQFKTPIASETPYRKDVPIVEDWQGKAIYHIDELQSDWHQAGRKYGYFPDMDKQTLDILESSKENQRQFSQLMLSNTLKNFPDANRIEDDKQLNYRIYRNTRKLIGRIKIEAANRNMPYRELFEPYSALQSSIHDIANFFKKYNNSEPELESLMKELKAERIDMVRGGSITAHEYVQQLNHNMLMWLSAPLALIDDKEKRAVRTEMRSEIFKVFSEELLAPSTTSDTPVTKMAIAKIETEFEKLAKVEKELVALRVGVADAPFADDNWIALGLKRGLIDAVENGNDIFAWSNSKILQGRWSDRYKELYDNQYNKKMVSLTKKITGIASNFVTVDGYMWDKETKGADETGKPVKNEAEFQEGNKGYHYIKITPDLKKRILGEGLPLFQDPADPLGMFDARDKEKLQIKLFQNADLSTLLHESGHMYVHLLGEMSNLPGASDAVQDNYKAMLNWVGAASSEDLNVSIHGESARYKQEKLAKAFEAYLKEGKAPSTRLQAAFAQFAAWLKRIYNSLRRLDVEIDDSIRQVFDRMLATDAQIAEMKVINQMDTWSSPTITDLMSPEEKSKYMDLQDAADEVARNETRRKENETEKRAEQEWWLNERGKRRKQVEMDLYRRPEYRAFWLLANGSFKDDETPLNLVDRRLDKQALLDMGFSQEQLTSLPRGKKRIYSDKPEDATDPELLAGGLGFDSGRELVEVILNMAPAQTAIDRETDLLMRSEFGDPVNDGTIDKFTEESLYNEARRNAIDLELKALAEKTGQQAVGRKIVKAVVDRVFSEQVVGDLLTPMKWQAASVRAARDAERAAAAGDLMGAFEFKRRQLLNHELFRRGLAAREEVKTINRKLRGYQTKKMNAKAIDKDFIAQVKQLLQFFEVGSLSLKRFELEGRAVMASDLMRFIERQRAAGEPIILPGDLVEVIGKDKNDNPQFAFKVTHWRQMTMPELKGLRDMADNLMKLGRDASEYTKQEKKKRGEDLAQGILDKGKSRKDKNDTLAYPIRKDQTADEKKGSYFASHRKMESLLRQLDGFQELGPMWRAVFEGLSEGQDKKTVFVQDLMKSYDDIFSAYTSKQRRQFASKKSGVAIKTLNNDILTHEMRLVIGLNWGSESSREAILEDAFMKNKYGAAWNETAIAEILGTLTDPDLTILEQVWKMVDQFWPEVARLERKHTGVVPAKVEASPFTVRGREITGGYYPLMYDNLNDDRAAQETEQNIMDKIKSGGFSRAATSHGFTNVRIGSGGRPVRKDIGVLMRHLDEVTQDVAYREAVMGAAEVLGNRDVRIAVKEVMGAPYLKALEEILVKTANGNMAATDGHVDGGWLKTARINVTTSIMGYNLRSILTQPAGLFQTWERIGMARMMQGVGQLYINPTKMKARIAEVNEKSTYMAHRAGMLTRELDDIVNKLDTPKFSDKVREAGFKPMVWMDVVAVAYPTWLGAYEQAMAGDLEGVAAGDEASAIKYADSTVRTTQGSGGAQNLAMIQQSSELWKLATMFYGYFNTTFNMEAEALAKSKMTGNYTSFVGSTILLSVIPAIVTGLFLEALPDEEDEDEDGITLAWAKWMGLQLANYTTGQLVIIRDLAHALTTNFDATLSPVESMGQAGVRAFKSLDDVAEYALDDGEVPKTFIKNFLRTIGMVFGVPGSNQLVKTVDYLIKLEADELKNPPRSKLGVAKQILFTGDR